VYDPLLPSLQPQQRTHGQNHSSARRHYSSVFYWFQKVLKRCYKDATEGVASVAGECCGSSVVVLVTASDLVSVIDWCTSPLAQPAGQRTDNSLVPGRMDGGKSPSTLQGCSKDVMRVLQGCYKYVMRVPRGCYKDVMRCHRGVTRTL
jgi:hypothetical protein